MARYVVLEFEYNEDADLFVGDMLHDGEDVVGVYAKPTQFCTSGGCGKGRVKAFVRGQKWGWWVCESCKRPSRAVAGPEQLMRAVIGSAINLLPDRESQLRSPFTRGWGVLNRA